jgi:hypothetical protein
MGSWNNTYFGNDGATDLFAELSKNRTTLQDWMGVLESSLSDFETFLERDLLGLTFRPLTDAELSEHDHLVRTALADFPNLIEQWNAGAKNEDLSVLLADTGDHEAQRMVAAAAIISGTALKDIPKSSRPPSPFEPSDSLTQRAQSAVASLLNHERLCGQFTGKWLDNTRILIVSRQPANNSFKPKPLRGSA